MEMGLLIKKERLKKGIKQINLAKGICSVSYLSKIENNLVSPNQEILNYLLDRLNIKLNSLNVENDKILNLLEEFYKEGILNRDKVKVFNYLEEIKNFEINYNLHEIYLLFNIYKFRLELIAGKELDELKPTVILMNSIKIIDNIKEYFMMHLNLGIFYYLEKQYLNALNHLVYALNSSNKIVIEDWELADFNNVLGLCYFENNNLINAEYYAIKSLKFYNDHLLLKRSIDCYILLGNIKKRQRDFLNAKKYYHLAGKISKELNITGYEGIIYQNLGSLSSHTGDYNEALKYYQSSLKYKNSKLNTSSYLLTVLSIIQLYSKIRDNQKVIYWCDKGIEIIGGKNETMDFINYYTHFKVYRAISLKDKELESILKSAVLFFEKQGDLRHVSKFSLILADYLTEINKYKAATIYYKKAITTLLVRGKIIKWEDI